MLRQHACQSRWVLKHSVRCCRLAHAVQIGLPACRLSVEARAAIAIHQMTVRKERMLYWSDAAFVAEAEKLQKN